MEPITLLLLGGAVLLASKKGGTVTLNLKNLPDVEPENQGGNYKRLYDHVYKFFSEKYGIPFALIKAHAYRESLQDKYAYRQEPKGKASYGLMQILWWKDSQRFQAWGYSDDTIGDGSVLYDEWNNVDIACRIIEDNFSRHSLRDAVNAYNTGVAETKRIAPGNYVDDVLKVYETLLGRKIV